MRMPVPIVLFALTLLLAACSSGPVAMRNIGAANGCMIDAVRYKDALKVRDAMEGVRWAEVLAVFWDARPSKNVLGHALCVFEYGGSTMVYDPSFGTSVLVKGRIEKNPRLLAEQWVLKERMIGRFPWSGEILNVTRFEDDGVWGGRDAGGGPGMAAAQ